MAFDLLLGGERQKNTHRNQNQNAGQNTQKRRVATRRKNKD